jgi:hypothetical protein
VLHQELSRFLWRRHWDEFATLENRINILKLEARTLASASVSAQMAQIATAVSDFDCLALGVNCSR